MNRLSTERQVQVLNALIEGNSIRSVSRMTGTHKTTIMRLICWVGEICGGTMSELMNNLPCRHIEVDEIWTFVYKKQIRTNEEDLGQRMDWGDQYVFVAMDADSRLIPCFIVGKRNRITAQLLMWDLRHRLNNHRVQITTDGFRGYIDPIEISWGADVDYAQLVKIYQPQHPGPGRYQPPKVKEVVSTTVCGKPDPEKVSTSYVERHNHTLRMCCRRFTRLTNGFSKKLENLKAAMALYFFWYNFIRIHRTLRVTPAMEIGIADHVWSWEEILQTAS